MPETATTPTPPALTPDQLTMLRRIAERADAGCPLRVSEIPTGRVRAMYSLCAPKFGRMQLAFIDDYGDLRPTDAGRCGLAISTESAAGVGAVA